jgi:hypothetical protein
MLKRKLSRGDIFIILSNLIPVYGVWFLGWSAVDVFIVYALETLLIGGITVLKMLVTTLFKKKDVWYNKGSSSNVSGLFFIFFFIIHFGLFAAVQTAIFSGSAKINPPGSGMLHFFFHFYEYINGDIAIMLAGFGVSYLAWNFIPFLLRQEYKTTPMMLLMFQPYGRIFIQQFTVILGSMFLTFGFGKGFILVFALAKILFEVMANFDGILDKTMKDLQKTDPPESI